MKKPLLTLLAIPLVLGILAVRSASSAEEEKPVLTVTFGGYDHLTSSVKTLGTLGGRPEADKMLDGMVGMITGGKGLPGLDKARPWVVAVYYDESGDFPFQAFVPVTDLKQLMAALPNPAGAPLAPDAAGVFEIKGVGGKTFFAIQKGTWAVVANSRDGLSDSPLDPTSLIGGLNKRYLLAVKVSIQNIPEEARKGALNKLKTLADATIQQSKGELSAVVNGVRGQDVKNLTKLSKELDQVSLGLGVDAGVGAMFLDVDVIALPGTDTAEKAALAKNSKTDFNGFQLPGAAMTLLSTRALDDADVARGKAALAGVHKAALKGLEGRQGLAPAQRDLAAELLSDTFDVLAETLDAKKTDGGAAILLDNGGPTLLAGMAVEDGKKLNNVVKRLIAELGKQQPDAAKMIKFDVENYEKIMFHVATIPVPEAAAAAIFGATVDVAVGVGEDSVYLAAGKNALANIKKVIDKSEDNVPAPAVQVAFAGAPIAKFVAQVSPDEHAKAVASSIAQLFSSADGKDHIALVSHALPNGVGARLTVEQGVIRAIVSQLPGGKH